MGDFLNAAFTVPRAIGSGIGGVGDMAGLTSPIPVSNVNPFQAIQGWQNVAGGLAGQLQQQSAGGGPNPAQMQFQQNAGQIAGQQAQAYAQNRALNPGLAARLAGTQGGQLQMQAANQAGIQQAQQQLASQQLLGGLAGSQQQQVNEASAINQKIAQGNQEAKSKLFGGVAQGAGAAFGMAAHGGMINPHMDMIRSIYHSDPKLDQVPQMDRFAEGGQVPVLVSPGERYLPPEDAKEVASGANPMKKGEKIPGKASVKGDSYKNDTVKANLEEGGIVIPRSILNSDNPEKEAQKFVAQALKKHMKSPEGEFKSALNRSIAGRKNK